MHGGQPYSEAVQSEVSNLDPDISPSALGSILYEAFALQAGFTRIIQTLRPRHTEGISSTFLTQKAGFRIFHRSKPVQTQKTHGFPIDFHRPNVPTSFDSEAICISPAVPSPRPARQLHAVFKDRARRSSSRRDGVVEQICYKGDCGWAVCTDELVDECWMKNDDIFNQLIIN